MNLTRRRLLGTAATAGVAATVAGCEADRPEPVVAPPSFDPKSWDSVRAQFALDPKRSHLATYVFAPHPQPVRAAIARHRDGLDADAIGYLHEHEEELDEAVASAAAVQLDTRPTQLAFTDSTTMGLGLLYTGLRLRAGDEVLTTEHDFYATHESLRLRSERDGVRVRRVQLYDDPAATSVDEIVGRLVGAVTTRVRVVAITWVHSGTGVKLPVRQIADALRERNPEALLCVDGVHGFGAEAATPDQLGCDFLVSGCHKWLLGPRGTGLVWGSSRGWAATTPVIPTFDRRGIGRWLGFSPGALPPGAAHTPGGYHSFEHRWALADAFGFHASIGRDRVAARTRELADRLKAGLAGIAGIRLVTPRSPTLSGGVVCCQVPGISVNEAVARVAAAGVVASSTPYQQSYLRFGATIANSYEDVDKAVRAVRGLV
ncbi:MAG TPA: aminotransferase class V-fold PLP-dependent enzyme [Micromonospora sp.]